MQASLPDALRQASWLQDDGFLALRDRGARGRDSPRVGHSARAQLLWLHRTYAFTPALKPMVEEHFEELLPSLYELDRSRDVLFVPGLGSSAILMRTVAAESERSLSGVRGVLSLMDLQWAYIAAAMEIDRTLFRRLNGFRAHATHVSASELELESHSVLELYDRVRLFRAAVNSIIIDLGDGTRRSWDVMARVQSLSDIVATIDDKLGALRDACEKLLNEASIKRQRMIALTVDLFAGFSVVASVAGVAGFFFATDLGASTVTRIVVLALAVLVVFTALIGTRLARKARVEASMPSERMGGMTSASLFTVVLDQTPGLALSDERFTVTFADGRREAMRLHEYDRVYAVPGLYEEVVQRRLKCASPAVLASALVDQVALQGEDPSRLAVLDVGAGNGLVGEELRQRGVAGPLVGVDNATSARIAAERDRPG